MNDRERWIIYPLLFLALGAALRDKMFKQTYNEKVVCKQVVLVDDSGRPVGEYGVRTDSSGDPVTVLLGTKMQIKADAIDADRIAVAALDAQAMRQAGRSVGAASQGSNAMLQQLLMRALRSASMGGATPAEPAEPAKPQSADPPPADPPAGEPAAPPEVTIPAVDAP